MSSRVWVERPIRTIEDAARVSFATSPDGRLAARLAISTTPWRVTPPHDASPNAPRIATDEDIVGWTALVPVEAEEETGKAWTPSDQPEGTGEITLYPGDPLPDWIDAIPTRRRLVTPWEDA